MAKFHLKQDSDGIIEYVFMCPGCGYWYWVRVKGPRPLWTWNGDLDRPTVNQSILVGVKKRCHSYVRDGKIQFLSDSSHHLAGQTVELPEWDGDAS